ncbi:unnamed protein product [marine sediment metagenome]|uniref:Uncharacterized protein n=1 Tax=marine sediment metagenome TaxID=412755 RepID=X0S1R3_9ZZZZ
MTAQYVIIGLIAGIIIGWILGEFSLKKRIAAHKRERQIRKRERQRKLLDNFRVEVKNNTIRLKKELKRIALSKQLAPIELLFKHYNKRLCRVADNEVLQVLQDFYKELTALLSANEIIIDFSEKNIQPNEKLEAEVIALFYNSMSAMIIRRIEKLVETGTVIVSILEEKIGEM